MIQIGDLVRWDDGQGPIRSYGIVLRLSGGSWGASGAQIRWEATSCGRWEAGTVWEPIDGLLVLSSTKKETK
jgi:hypothetical protein